MKKIFISIFSLFMCLFFIGCGTQKVDNVEENLSIFRETFQEAKDLKEVSDIAGFSIEIPKKFLEGDFKSEIRAIKGRVIQLTFYGMEQLIVIRKVMGSDEDDISRDFNDYPEMSTETVGNTDILLRGNDGKINVIAWRSGSYSYAVNINPGGLGFSKDDAYKIMRHIK